MTASRLPIELLKASPHRLHIFRSGSTNPYFNLSVEDYLLRRSPATSTILFTYVNRPCIVIGRNQNPWREINFPLLNSPEYAHVDFVRRRSGGGTVYHDLGNLCWSVIMPRREFDRDRNAHLVVDALKKLGVQNAAVNARHDIVLREEKRDLKVSGSAYKIIKERSYHHATLLVNSELRNIGKLLHSPLEEFLETHGVESFRSFVANLGVDMMDLVAAIEEQFERQYKQPGDIVQKSVLEERETLNARSYIRRGMDELETKSWLTTQTPRFKLIFPTENPIDELPELPGVVPMLPEYGKFNLMMEHGKIVHSSITTSPDPDFAFVQSQESHNRLLDSDFSGPNLREKLAQIESLNPEIIGEFSRWLEVAVGPWRGKDERNEEEADDMDD